MNLNTDMEQDPKLIYSLSCGLFLMATASLYLYITRGLPLMDLTVSVVALGEML